MFFLKELILKGSLLFQWFFLKELILKGKLGLLGCLVLLLVFCLLEGWGLFVLRSF